MIQVACNVAISWYQYKKLLKVSNAQIRDAGEERRPEALRDHVRPIGLIKKQLNCILGRLNGLTAHVNRTQKPHAESLFGCGRRLSFVVGNL